MNLSEYGFWTCYIKKSRKYEIQTGVIHEETSLITTCMVQQTQSLGLKNFPSKAVALWITHCSGTSFML